MSLHFTHLLPFWLTTLLAGALLVAILYGIATMLRKNTPGRLVAILAGLRLAIVIVFVLALFQPSLSFTSETKQLPELAILVDVSKSMGLPSQAAGTNRLDEMRAVLHKSDLGRALRDRFELAWFAFDGTAVSISEEEVSGLKSAGDSTRIAASIAAAAAHLRGLGKNPERYLIVSDGQDHGSGDPVSAAQKLGALVDVLAPTAAPVSTDTKLEIMEVQAARRVLLGSETHFHVVLGGRQPAVVDRTITLLGAENGKSLFAQKVEFKAGQLERTISLAHRPASAGVMKYEFWIDGRDEKSQKKAVSVQVGDSKYELLILEDTWRWEYKFLHRLFEDDPSFRFTALLPRGGKGFAQFGSPDRRVNLVGLPQNRADLEGFDTFVLGDVNPTRWPRGLASSLAQLVTEEGKSLVVIAGPNLANLADLPELHSLLPVELSKESGTPIEGAIDVRLRADAGSSPFFFQVPVGDADKMPPLDRVYPVLRKRPGATVLLEAVKHRNPNGNLIVMAEQTVGKGRVLFLATDTLWKWQTLSTVKDGPTPYAVFWQQALRALTPARSITGPTNLWLTVDRTRSEVGRPVIVQAEVQSERPLAITHLQGSATFPDESALPLLFTVDSANPRIFRAEFVPRQSGGVHIGAKVVTAGKTAAEGSTLVQVDESRGESEDRGIDLASLTRLASATGGRVVDPARPETWPAPGETELPSVRRLRTVDLWNNFTLLLLLCVLLGADWFLRLFKGLV